MTDDNELKKQTQYGIFVGTRFVGTWDAEAWPLDKLTEHVLWRYGPDAYVRVRVVYYSDWADP